MEKNVSCGGIVIHRGKILLLYKKIGNRSDGWVFPKGTVEEGETHEETALREVFEESGAKGTIMGYIGSYSYSFRVHDQIIHKDVHWFLMQSQNYYSHPRQKEFFEDSGYYKYHEAIHLLSYPNEKQILEKAYEEYLRQKHERIWYEPREPFQKGGAEEE